MIENYLNKKEEKKLIKNFLSGNKKAEELYVTTYLPCIERVIHFISIKNNFIEKSDLIHDFYLYLVQDDKKVIRSFKFGSSHSTYLTIVCRRYVLSIVNKENKKGKKHCPMHLNNISEKLCKELSIYDTFTRLKLQMVINNLDYQSKLFITMAFIDDCPNEQIMKYFGWTSANSVFTKKRRIIKLIRDRLNGIE